MKQKARRILGAFAVSSFRKTVPLTRLSLAFCFALFIVILSGCGAGNDDPECGSCTAEFRRLVLSVIDQSGNPATDVNITVNIKRTQEVLAINQESFFTSQGQYDVFDDGFVDRITTDAAGETLIVAGNSQGRVFTLEIVVKTDPCRCHFEKVSGPSTITL